MSIKEILLYDFRRLQAASLRLPDDEVKSFHDGSKEPNEGVRRLLGSVLGREISRVSNSDGNDVQLLKHPKKEYKDMGMHVYIGKVQSETFDYEIAKAGEGDYHGYYPDQITPYLECNGLYGVIMNHEDAVQTDWGCWVVKMQKEDILDHVIQWGSIVDHKWLVEFLEYETDYLLVALETV